MVRSALALSLLGLSAVNALPKQRVEERQAWIIGGGEGSFGSGSSDCQIGTPSGQQGACIWQPITGGLNPPKVKRDGPTQVLQQLKQFEQDLVRLQNKQNKTEADKQKIKDLQKKIKHLAGIISISAPDGSSVTFTPGKRDSITFEPIGAFSSECPQDVSGVENALRKLLTIRNPSMTEFLAIQRLTHILTGCGYSISDDGATFVKISDKRSLPSADLAIITGLQNAYTQALTALNGAKPSFSTWLILQSVADQLEYYGVSVDRGAGFGSTTVLVPRQGEFKLGCLGSDLIALTVFWNALSSQFGRDPSKWPRDVYWHFYSVLEALRTCGIDVGELTPQPTVPGGSLNPDPTVPGGSLKPDPSKPGGSLKPDPVIPGGAMVPQPTIPGGSIKPDPSVPGGSLNPDPTVPGGALKPGKVKRDDNSSVMLEALDVLQKAYGGDASKVPAAIRPSVDTIVADLRGEGVVVIGWPTTQFGISP